MNTETLKINIAQKILSLDNLNLLEKIKNLLNSESTPYLNHEGNLLSKEEFVHEMDQQQEEIKNGTAKFHSIEEVRKMVINESNLGR